MRKLTYFFIFCFCLSPNKRVTSQEKIISVRVVVFDSIPIIGALVQIKSSKQTILTDSLGEFKTAFQPNDQIKISAEGFYSRKIKDIKKLNIIKLKLRSGERNMRLAISKGYITNSKSFKNAWLLNNDKSIDYSKYTTFLRLMESQFPNADIQRDKIVIRGTKSLGTKSENGDVLGGSSAVLIVIDGFLSDFNMLSNILPVNVKSVKIVTGSSAIMYGAGAVNGVLVIKTKNFAN